MEEKYSMGKIISGLRAERGLTQKQLAYLLNVTDKTVAKWESDKGRPNIEIIPKIAKLFGVSIDHLMLGLNASNGEHKDKEVKIDFERVKRITSEIEKKCVHEGVLIINEMIDELGINDVASPEQLEAAKELLKYPLNYSELLWRKLKRKEFKELFRFAVDNNLVNLAEALLLHAWGDVCNMLYNYRKFVLDGKEYSSVYLGSGGYYLGQNRILQLGSRWFDYETIRRIIASERDSEYKRHEDCWLNKFKGNSSGYIYKMDAMEVDLNIYKRKLIGFLSGDNYNG